MNPRKEGFKMYRKFFILFTLLTAVFFLFSGISHAQTWKPTKPITIIVPWPAGGATDLTVRILAS